MVTPEAESVKGYRAREFSNQNFLWVKISRGIQRKSIWSIFYSITIVDFSQIYSAIEVNYNLED